MVLDFPNTPIDGQVYDNYYWDNEMSAWRAFGNLVPLVPAGVISQYAGSAAPDGYLLCTGQSLSTTTYPALFAAIGYTYGGSGSNFNIPNLQNRVPVGLGTETEFDALGETGGSKTHTLTIDQMPSHTHIQNAHNHNQDAHSHTQSSHNHTFSLLRQLMGTDDNNYSSDVARGDAGAQSTATYTTSSATPAIQNTTATNQAATATNQNTGGGLAHNNLQPYIVLNYIIKT